MERLPKIGILTGIGAIVFFSVIFAIAMSDNIADSMIRIFMDKDKIMNEMKEKPSVVLFAEKFPDHYVQEHKNRHNVSLELFDYNFETGNKLRLNINFDPWDDQMREHIRCDIADNRYRSSLGFHTDFALSSSSINYPQIFLNEGRAENEFVLDFIKYTNCLEIDQETKDSRETSIPHKNTGTDTYIEIPIDTGMPGCEGTNTCYSPNRVVVIEGDVVEWKNVDNAAHTVTSGTPENGPEDYFDSSIIMTAQSFRIQFDAAGEYNYFCMVHPWMEGMVIVEETSKTVILDNDLTDE